MKWTSLQVINIFRTIIYVYCLCMSYNDKVLIAYCMVWVLLIVEVLIVTYSCIHSFRSQVDSTLISNQIHSSQSHAYALRASVMGRDSILTFNCFWGRFSVRLDKSIALLLLNFKLKWKKSLKLFVLFYESS